MEEEKIDRIVQLDIEIEGLTEEELEEFGVDIVSLVEDPAIGVDFMTFNNVELESYDDYPKAASANAQRALDWAEENGWGSCGTAVGKRRANQLAKRQPISEETIARMSAFRRQQQNKNTPYGEGCGGLMWDAWGGDEGINWAERKLKQIRKEASAHTGSYEAYFNEEQEEAIIDYAINNGVELSADDVIIDLNNKEFRNVTETVEAIRGLDLLKRLQIEENKPKTYYRYSGPPAERKFCKAMVNLSKAGKIFSEKDIERMDGLNKEFSKKGQNEYSIFKYKGGKNCKHRWEKLAVFENSEKQKLVIIESPSTKKQETAATVWANLRQTRKKKDIYLISCVSEKLDRKAKACELYNSALFKKSLEYARKKVSDDQIFILSAKYHIIPLNKVIEPYDMTLNDMPYTERQEWADKVYSQMEKLFDVHNDKFYFMAGNSYTEYLLDRFKYKKDVLDGKKIGERMEWLDKFYAVFNSHEKVNHNLSVDEDKKIVTGPLMIPNKMILRRDDDGKPYYIFFNRETIRKMAEKFLRTNKHNNTDIQHDNKVTNDNTLLESWISEDKMYDKAYKMGFALPMGTWYVSYKINNDDTWKQIKAGELKGFSLAGPFIEKMASEGIHNQKLQSIIDILEQVND